MNCDRVQDKLSNYLEGGLDPVQERTVIDHLSSCAACLNEAERLKATIQSVAHLPSVDAPPGFSQKVMARLRDEAGKPGLWRRLFSPFWIKIPIHAAALILVAVFAAYLYQAYMPKKTQFAKGTHPAADEGPTTEAFKTDSSPATEPFADRLREAEAPARPGPREGEQAAASNARTALKQKIASTTSQDKAGGEVSGQATEIRPEAGPAPGEEPPAATPPQEPVYQLTLLPNPGFSQPEAFSRELEMLLDKSAGRREAVQSEALVESGVLMKRAAGIQDFWISIPEERYDLFRSRLASMGNITAEKKVPQATKRQEPGSIDPAQSRRAFDRFSAQSTLESSPPSPGRRILILLAVSFPDHP